MGSYSHFLRENTANTANTCGNALARYETKWDAESHIPANSKCSKRSICIGSEDGEERTAIAEFDGGAPLEWAEAFSRVQCSPPLPGFTQSDWETLIDDGGRFLDKWASKATELGWSAQDLFGLDPNKPSARVDQMGLVPLIRGREVAAITDTTAILKTKNGTLTYYRHKRGGVPVWELIGP